ncbi:MAG: thymidine phosphorylase family protein [Alphaproteobacteria bacterium]|jgi:thymidine phosphorylase|nr:thymidine phosphorylase family protein [Alphaproteobacteria bacterium]
MSDQQASNHQNGELILKRLDVDTYSESIIFLHHDSHVCRAEGLQAFSRVQVTLGKRSVIATLYKVHSDLLPKNVVFLSNYAWKTLKAHEGASISVSHPPPLKSLSCLHSKIYGNTLNQRQFDSILADIMSGNYSDIHISAFLTACGSENLNQEEVTALTKSMVKTGDTIDWGHDFVVDKHCVGGLPGNRTTLLVVPIIAAYGLLMPKTSSRAITSPAGTADTMEVFAPVELTLDMMRKVVRQENGCIAWGGSVNLSPVDDLLIRIERVLDFDGEGQLVASILSKKIAAGSTQILIDMPVGPTAKIRTHAEGDSLAKLLKRVGHELGVMVDVLFSDGLQPVGRGIGPTLEAFDILQVLQGSPEAPQDLRERALTIAAKIIEFQPHIHAGMGRALAEEILVSGKAWEKFVKICEAQGGFRTFKLADHTHEVLAERQGKVTQIDNRAISRLAKLAGAPHAKRAGIRLHTPLEAKVEKGQPLFTVYADTRSELDYALAYLEQDPNVIRVDEA